MYSHPFRQEHENGGPSSLPIYLSLAAAPPFCVLCKRVGYENVCVLPTLFVTNTKMVGHPLYLSPEAAPPFCVLCKRVVTKTCVSPHPFRNEHENGGPSSLPIPELPHHFRCKRVVRKRVCLPPFRQEHEWASRTYPPILAAAPPFCVLCKRVGYENVCVFPPFSSRTRKWWAILFTYLPIPRGCPTILRTVQKGGLRKRVCLPTLFVKNTKMVGHPLYLSLPGCPTILRFVQKGGLRKRVCLPTLFVKNTKMMGHPR